LWRRRWFVITAGIILVLLLIGALSGDPEKPADRAAAGDAQTTATPTPTPTPTPDPAIAARAKAADLAGDGRYADAVAVLEAAGLNGQAARVARRGSQALASRARRELAAGDLAKARDIAVDARALHPSTAVRALIRTVDAKLAAARAAAILARDQRTCTGAEKATVRAGSGIPAGCTTFAADLATRRAKAQAAEAAEPCDPNYKGACLDPNSSDYDCAGGSGDGPDYTGFVEVVGDDPYDLDRDGDGIACES
jgi:hypothetical protein